jgi:flagellar motor switch protein FliG
MLAGASSIPDTIVDTAIYTIYLLLVLLLGMIAWVGYALFDQDPAAVAQRFEEETETAVTTGTSPKREKKSVFPGSGESSEHAASSETMQVARQKVESDMPEGRQGFELVEASHAKPMAKYLMKQHPQLRAAVLMMIDAKKADAILEYFDASQREALIRTAAESRPVSTSVLRGLDLALYQELTPLRRDYTRLNRLKDDEIRAILRQIDKRELMFALKGATQELQERFFANMSSKASGEFRSTMALLPLPGTMKSQNAVKKLLLLAEQLRDDGRIRITKNVY